MKLKNVVGLVLLFAMMFCLSACTDYEGVVDDKYEEWKASVDDIPNSSSKVVLSSSSSVILNDSEGSSSSVKDGSEYDASANALTDLRDSQVYKTVTIGTQTWMAENLNYNYNEGTAKSYCYENDASKCDKYGRLYLWSAAMDSAAVFSTAGKDCGYGKTCSPSGFVRGVCPEGWHLPSMSEWETLLNEVGGAYKAGTRLKNISGWSSGGNGSNLSGFSALPAGSYDSYKGQFDNVGNYVYFWSSTEDNSYNAHFMDLTYDDDYAELSNYYKDRGRSVRCLLDSNEGNESSSSDANLSSSQDQLSSSSAPSNSCAEDPSCVAVAHVIYEGNDLYYADNEKNLKYKLLSKDSEGEYSINFIGERLNASAIDVRRLHFGLRCTEGKNDCDTYLNPDEANQPTLHELFPDYEEGYDSQPIYEVWIKINGDGTLSVYDSEPLSSSSSVASSSSIKYGSLTDSRDGQVYKTVTIGTQTWMAENLNYAYTGVKYNYSYNYYSSYTSDSTSWCYENKASNCDKYGRLYTWSAVMDSAAQFSVNAGTQCGYGKTCTPNSPHRGICPEGWHVPTDEEYSTLYTYIGGSSTAGSLLKSTSGWNDYNGKSGNGTDKYGFSVLTAGIRDGGGSFSNEGYHAYLWSASEDSSYDAWYQYFHNSYDYVYQGYYYKNFGLSLRCLKD